ncbi:TonB-dependent siderophore receptor [Deminuibacter soli]|uniref:TonB-dependent siderophore receptor n=2 Tax=Deminuibacter soli TaxID=2291815 RepID=A0A3E1NRQ6_9BACT|nr:TonB-dependent siderophore receptor [Deminuibacter soli]
MQVARKVKGLMFLGLLILFVNSAMAIDTEEPGGTISGKVTTADGTAAANVTIKITGTKKTTTTDEDGTFSFSNVASGSYSLEITLVGFGTVTQNVTVEKHKTATVQVQLTASEKQLEEVKVVSRGNKFAKTKSDYVARMPLSNLENPQVYTVISKELMQEQVITNQDDALRNVPGLYKIWGAVGRADGGGAYFASRGFNTQSAFRNGIAGRVSSNADAANLEKIESIKGPSATLFGSALTSYGGLINRVTKRPYDHLGGEVGYTFGSYGLNRVTADINTPLNKDKTVLFRLNTAYNDENSFQDYGYSKSYFLAPVITYKASDRLSFSLEAEFNNVTGTTPSLLYFNYSGDPAWNTTVSNLGATRADQLLVNYKRSYLSNDLALNSKTANVFGQMNYKISDQWTSQTNFTTTSNTSDGTMTWLYLLPGGTSATRNAWYNNASDKTIEIQQNFIGDFHIGSMRNRLVAGLDYYANDNITNYSYFSGYNTVFDTISFVHPNPNYTAFNKANVLPLFNGGAVYKVNGGNNIYSAYASDVLNITDALLVNAALRLDRFHNRGTYSADADATTGKFDQTALSPKFGIVYQVLKDKVSLFGNYQNSFSNKDGQDFEGKTFKPEQANQWEGGVKLNAFNGKLSSTLSYYDISVKNIVRTDPVHPNFSVQNGTQSSKGFEAEVIANPIKGVDISAGYAYNDSKYTESDPDVNGLRPVTAGPKHLVNFWASYHFSNETLKGLGIGFGGNYGSDNRSINSVSTGAFILPSYTVLNASVFYNKPSYRITLKMDNLTNEKYWNGWTTINPQMLRRFVASVAFKF